MSMTSPESAVTPQAALRLLPETITGRPGTSAPIASTTPGTDTCSTWNAPGVARPRCGSFASTGLPLAERAPPTTNSLLDMLAPSESGSGYFPSDQSHCVRSSDAGHGPADAC